MGGLCNGDADRAESSIMEKQRNCTLSHWQLGNSHIELVQGALQRHDYKQATFIELINGKSHIEQLKYYVDGSNEDITKSLASSGNSILT